jgi:hypothetical protein
MRLDQEVAAFGAELFAPAFRVDAVKHLGQIIDHAYQLLDESWCKRTA